jgi:hypothetical protein
MRPAVGDFRPRYFRLEHGGDFFFAQAVPRRFVQRVKNVPLFNVGDQAGGIGSAVQYQRHKPVIQILPGEGGAYLLLKERFEPVRPHRLGNLGNDIDVLLADFPLALDYLPGGRAAGGPVRFTVFRFGQVFTK